MLHLIGKSGLQFLGLVTVSTVAWTATAYLFVEGKKEGYFSAIPTPSEVSSTLVSRMQDFQSMKRAETNSRRIRDQQDEEIRLAEEASHMQQKTVQEVLHSHNQPDADGNRQ